ncbi:MAG: hypothetical protein U9R42_14225 [Bacteroidota bacterium]|nr:hypothetical protein [Bacteroidota bacterium]
MNQKTSAKKYLQTRSHKLPYHECFINSDWQEKGMATIMISKKQPSGNYIFALYLIDIFCLGLKNTFFDFNKKEMEYEDIKDNILDHEDMIDIEVDEAHNIIYGAIDYAEDLGFYPHKDFKTTEYLLNSDYIDKRIDEIEFGKDGKPLFIQGIDDNVHKILNTLNKNVGKGNYDFFAMD